MAITFTDLTEGTSTTNTSDYTTASISPGANKLIVVGVLQTRATSPPNQPTVVGNGITYTLQGSLGFNTAATPLSKLFLYAGLTGATPSAGTVVIGNVASDNTACAWAICEFAGVQLGAAASDSIIQLLSSAVNAASDIVLTFAALRSAGSALFTFAGFDLQQANVVTPETDWIQLADVNVNNPASSLYAQYKIGSGDLTASHIKNGVNADMAAIGIELWEKAILVVQDATVAIAADNLALVQHNVLAVADQRVTIAQDNLVLTQHNLLAIQDALVAIAADNLVLTYHAVLAIQDALVAIEAENLSLTQHNALAIQDATVAISADNLALVQHNILIVQDMLTAISADNLDLVQHNILAIQDALIAIELENIVLTYNPPGGGPLEIQDMLVAVSAENLALIQHNLLAIQDALVSIAADNLVLTYNPPGGAPPAPDTGAGGVWTESWRSKRRRAQMQEAEDLVILM